MAIFIAPFVGLVFFVVPRPLRDVRSFVVGFGLSGLAVVLYAMGAAHLWYPSVMLLVWAVPAVFVIWQLAKARRQLLKTLSVHLESWWIVTWPWLALLAWFTCVGPTNRGTIYPSFECDASLMHLMLPKIYLHNHGLVDAWWTRAPFLPQSQHGLFVGVSLFAQLLSLRHDTLYNFLAFFQCCGLALALGDFIGKRGAAICAFVALVSYPVIRWSVGTVYLDIPNAFYVTLAALAAYSFVRAAFVHSPHLRLFAATAGWFAAMALTVKHMGGLYLCPILGLTLAALSVGICRKKFAVRFLAPSVLVGFLAALIPLAIFYTRNVILTGDPLFPFFSFSEPNGYHWDRASYLGFKDAVAVWTKDKFWYSPLQAIWAIASDPTAYSDTREFPVGMFLVYQLALFGFAGLLASRFAALRDWRIFLPAIIFLADAYLWYFSSPVIRYLLPGLALLLVSLLYLLFHGPALTRFLAAVCLFAGLTVPKNLDRLNNLPVEPPLTEVGVKKFGLAEYLLVPSDLWFERSTPKDSIVYTYGTSCGSLYVPRPFVGDWFGLWNYSDLIQAGQSREAFLAFFKQTGINYVQFAKESTLTSWSDITKFAPDCVEEMKEADSDYASVYRFMNEKPECDAPRVTRDPRSDELRRLSPSAFGFTRSTPSR